MKNKNLHKGLPVIFAGVILILVAQGVLAGQTFTVTNTTDHPLVSFIDSVQELGNSTTFSVASADLDEDGDLDAFITNGDYSGSIPSTVWINDGKGRLIDSGQKLDTTKFARVELGDFNGDNHIDVFISNVQKPNQIWLNDGSGNFVDSGLRLSGDARTAGCAVGDLDGDGDLDVFVAVVRGGANEVWFNERYQEN
jgi:hypothetical protein